MPVDDVLATDGQSQDQAAEIAQLKADLEKKDTDYKSLQSDYTVKTQELSEVKKQVPVKTETLGFDPSKLSEEDRATYDLVKKAGGITQDVWEKSQSEIQSLKDSIKSVNDRFETQEQTKQREKLETTISKLAAANTFVDPQKLKSFMAERSEKGEILSPESAMVVLYKDQIIAAGLKPSNLPGVDKSAKEDLTQTKVAETKPNQKINDPDFQKSLAEELKNLGSVQ